MTEPKTGPGLDLLIVGAGFAGLYALYKARQQGLRALVIESAPSVGGTWWHNRYPGARVDIQSMEYSFEFSEELQQEWHWTERYAPQAELLAYANHVADRFALRDGIRLNTRLAGAEFDEAAGCWHTQSETGDTWTSRFLVLATGGLSVPNLPRIPGLESFAGRTYHTADWPHEAVDFTGRRVGVIGTGSSGVQVIPLIAEQARELTVFQRTPVYVVPAHNGPLDPAYEARIKADYAGFRARNRAMFGALGSDWAAVAETTFSIDEASREAAYEERWRIGGFSFLRAFADLPIDPRANQVAAEFVRKKIRSIVRDPETARRLSPSYPIGCKRLSVGTGYYETYNRPNVRLVDVAEQPIEEVTPSGVRVGGQEHVLDALVLATGFDAMTGALTRMDLRGRGGLTIQQKWQAGPRNYLGLMVAGFPNMFHIAGPGSSSAFTNVIKSIEHHVDWITECISFLHAQGHATIDATEQAEAAWVGLVNAVAEHTVLLSCNSWYLGANIPGKPRVFMPFAAGYPAYVEQCAAVARDGYRGCELR